VTTGRVLLGLFDLRHGIFLRLIFVSVLASVCSHLLSRADDAREKFDHSVVLAHLLWLGGAVVCIGAAWLNCI
jgi:hypothetical protein